MSFYVYAAVMGWIFVSSMAFIPRGVLRIGKGRKGGEKDERYGAGFSVVRCEMKDREKGAGEPEKESYRSHHARLYQTSDIGSKTLPRDVGLCRAK